MIALVLSACTVEKRKYLSGYYIQKHKLNESVTQGKQNSKQLIPQEKTWVKTQQKEKERQKARINSNQDVPGKSTEDIHKPPPIKKAQLKIIELNKAVERPSLPSATVQKAGPKRVYKLLNPGLMILGILLFLLGIYTFVAGLFFLIFGIGYGVLLLILGVLLIIGGISLTISSSLSIGNPRTPSPRKRRRHFEHDPEEIRHD